MVVKAKLVESFVDFFGSLFSHYGSVLEILSVVYDFLLSSPRCDCVLSGGASISFWNISGKKFERRQGWTHGHANFEIWRNTLHLVKFCGKQHYTRNLIPVGFETWKPTSVLRCAQYSRFRWSHVHAPWVVCMGLVHEIMEMKIGFRHVSKRWSQ